MSIERLCDLFSRMELNDFDEGSDAKHCGDVSQPIWSHHDFGWDNEQMHGGDESVRQLLARKPKKPPARPSDPKRACCFKCGDIGHKAAVCSSGGERCFCCGKYGKHLAEECRNRHPDSIGKGRKCWNCGGGHKMTRCHMPKWCNMHKTWHNNC
ncbi:hypothetical protein niasHT_000594 [Heterodera trifolii]|uniref:CCHC-type domain-containing protein n=1 Tax=Heterodera trifolii TaxID=157864 RepID=A0ABD2LZ99_9BILA